jgi:ferric-dicitrate binding protein FerR (iron transport regulator)
LISEDLLSKFFAGNISSEDEELLKKWINENPENRKAFDQANESWQNSSVSRKFDVDAAWKIFSERHNFVKSEDSRWHLKRGMSIITLAAAGIALVMIIGSLFILKQSKNIYNQLSDSKIVVTAKDGEKAYVLMSDSSEIILNSGSRLEYDAGFNIHSREVRLFGEAFFEVHKNEVKPFVVESEGVKIIATGTKFNVLSFPEESRIEATLVEGEISVRSGNGKSVKVNPGEQCIYTKQTRDLEIRKIHIDSYTSWKENKLRLSDTPLEESFRKIARKYNVAFNITDIKLLDLKYTATFIDEDIVDVMEMLKVVSPITYKISYRTGVTDKHYIRPMIRVAYKKKN